MPTRLNRALQVRTADRLRASLARDQFSGLPRLASLSDGDQRELREVGGGRLAAIAFSVAWLIDASVYPRPIHEVESAIMREVATRIDAHVRRTDLLAVLRERTLVILAPALDPASGLMLAERLRQVFAGLQLQVGDLHVELRIDVGVAFRSAASPDGWTARSVAEEAQGNTSPHAPPFAIVA